jgi:hypothetical protein
MEKLALKYRLQLLNFKYYSVHRLKIVKKNEVRG